MMFLIFILICLIIFIYFRYFKGGISSCYCWGINENEFGCSVLIKKPFDITDEEDFISEDISDDNKNNDNTNNNKNITGFWDSIHVLQISNHSTDIYSYQLTTTILLYIQMDKNTDLSGSMTRQVY